MSIDVNAIIKVIANGVSALMVLGGIILLLFGYPINHSHMIIGGWGLIFLGGFFFIIELLFAYYKNQ